MRGDSRDGVGWMAALTTLSLRARSSCRNAGLVCTLALPVVDPPACHRRRRTSTMTQPSTISTADTAPTTAGTELPDPVAPVGGAPGGGGELITGVHWWWPNTVPSSRASCTPRAPRRHCCESPWNENSAQRSRAMQLATHAAASTAVWLSRKPIPVSSRVPTPHDVEMATNSVAQADGGRRVDEDALSLHEISSAPWTVTNVHRALMAS